MAKKEKTKEVVKDTTKNEPKSKETKGDITKVQAKMTKKPKVIEETITKIDLNKPPKIEEPIAKEKEQPVVEEIKKEIKKEAKEEPIVETPIVEEITDPIILEASIPIPEITVKTQELKGPNFRIDTRYEGSIPSTTFNKTELLESRKST